MTTQIERTEIAATATSTARQINTATAGGMNASTAMGLDEAIRTRRSVRGFLPAQVPETVLREVIQLALHAPSNCNVQPWLVHVASGATLQALRTALVDACLAGLPTNPDWPADTKRYRGTYRERQIDAAVQLYGAMEIGRTDTAGRQHAYVRNFALFDAPHAIFIFLPQPFDIREAADMGMFAQTLMLGLTSRGIASCAQGALGEYPDIVRQHLNLDPTHRLLFGVSLGYEDPAVKANAARVGRAAFEQIVSFHD